MHIDKVINHVTTVTKMCIFQNSAYQETLNLELESLRDVLSICFRCYGPWLSCPGVLRVTIPCKKILEFLLRAEGAKISHEEGCTRIIVVVVEESGPG